jgi:hypothetical protein
MQAKLSDKLSARDFVYVYEPGIGQSYQNGPYLISVGHTPLCSSYTVTYRDQRLSWHQDFLSAVAACQRHEATRLYTRRCENAEQGLRRQEDK